jgi:hypothetical protein
LIPSAVSADGQRGTASSFILARCGNDFHA